MSEVEDMHPTYKGSLRGNRIEWEDEAPEQIESQGALTVLVTILGKPVAADETSGRRMADALQRLALRGGVRSIIDPVRWQCEQREDRKVPGRT